MLYLASLNMEVAVHRTATRVAPSEGFEPPASRFEEMGLGVLGILGLYTVNGIYGEPSILHRNCTRSPSQMPSVEGPEPRQGKATQV